MIVPDPDPLTQAYWDGAKEQRLLLQRCASCSNVWHPPAPACNGCGAVDYRWQQARGTGSVHSFIVVRESPDPWVAQRVPLVVALVRLDDGPLIITNLVDCEPDAARVSMRVELCWEELAPGVVLPQFTPSDR